MTLFRFHRTHHDEEREAIRVTNSDRGLISLSDILGS